MNNIRRKEIRRIEAELKSEFNYKEIQKLYVDEDINEKNC